VSTDEGLLLGRPLLDGVTVKAEVLGGAQGPKLVVQKIRRRTHNSRTKTGHRQLYTRVRIDEISGPNIPKPKDSPEKAEKPASEETDSTDAPDSKDE
jgi:large subunit ribosomal protein L21